VLRLKGQSQYFIENAKQGKDCLGCPEMVAFIRNLFVCIQQVKYSLPVFI